MNAPQVCIVDQISRLTEPFLPTTLLGWVTVVQAAIAISAFIIALMWAIPKFEQNYRKVNYERKVIAFATLIEKWSEYKRIAVKLYHLYELDRRMEPDIQQAETRFKEYENSVDLILRQPQEFEKRKTFWFSLVQQRNERNHTILGLGQDFIALQSDCLGLLGQLRLLSDDYQLLEDLYNFCDAIYTPGGYHWHDFNREQTEAAFQELENQAGKLIDRMKHNINTSAQVLPSFFGLLRLITNRASH